MPNELALIEQSPPEAPEVLLHEAVRHFARSVVDMYPQPQRLAVQAALGRLLEGYGHLLQREIAHLHDVDRERAVKIAGPWFPTREGTWQRTRVLGQEVVAEVRGTTPSEAKQYWWRAHSVDWQLTYGGTSLAVAQKACDAVLREQGWKLEEATL